MISIVCIDQKGSTLLEFSVNQTSPLSQPYYALSECIKETKNQLVKQNKLSEVDRIKIAVLNEKWIPDGRFEAKFNETKST